MGVQAVGARGRRGEGSGRGCPNGNRRERGEWAQGARAAGHTREARAQGRAGCAVRSDARSRCAEPSRIRVGLSTQVPEPRSVDERGISRRAPSPIAPRARRPPAMSGRRTTVLSRYKGKAGEGPSLECLRSMSLRSASKRRLSSIQAQPTAADPGLHYTATAGRQTEQHQPNHTKPDHQHGPTVRDVSRERSPSGSQKGTVTPGNDDQPVGNRH